jgi:hypothetical protein
MKQGIDILNELNNISPLVAGIGNTNIFIVPTGYFDTVATTVTACIKNETPANQDVPAGYFDGLSEIILSKIEGTAAHELQDISPFMTGIKKVNPFEAPVHYFQEFPLDVTARLEEDIVPAALQGKNKMQPFEIPAGYFEQLADAIQDKVKEANAAKVIAMPKRSNAIFKYAAAAVFTGLVAIGVYKYAGNKEQIAAVNGSEIATNEQPVPVNNKMDDKKFEETLNNLNEDDIVKYLEKNGSENDMAVLTSSIDETSLPNEEDYLTDDATLDKFLEDIQSKN